jgi:hypothetical protein
VATHRHKREPNARRLAAFTGSRAARYAVGAAIATTLPAVALGVVAADPSVETHLVAQQGPAIVLDPARHDAAPPVSRTFDRVAARHFQAGVAAQEATARAVRGAHVKKWATVDLNLWSSSSQAARQVGLVKAGSHVLVTGRTADGRAELVVDGQSRWVTAEYLAAKKPHPASASASSSGSGAAAGLSMAACPDGSVEYRLTAAAVYVYRSVCHAFPQITSYGGWDAHGEHASGKALDIMTSDKALGDQIAAFLQAHAAELNLFDVIWWDRIWTPVRASEGWRAYGNHGSPTADHMDHVHVSVN